MGFFPSHRTCGVYYNRIDADDASSFAPRNSFTSCLPLLYCSAHAAICNTSSRVTLKQTFLNRDGNKPISEAAYTFPLYEGASVVAFACTVGDRTIHGVIKEKDKAKKMYDVAQRRGSSAGLLVQNTPDVWSTKIGNIPEGGKVAVQISYLCELKHDSEVDGIRFVLPNRIAPRYGQAPHGVPSSGVQDHVEHLEITVAVTMTSPIHSLQSSSHPIAVGMGTLTPNLNPSRDQFDICKGHASLSQTGCSGLEKDFVLLIVSADIGSPQAIVETHPGLPSKHRMVMLSLVPKFELPRIRPEIVFIADRSGSMREKVPQLRRALTVFLNSLPVGVKFNICSFGSNFSYLWPKSRAYDQETFEVALAHVQGFEASYGGTKLYEPIEATLKNRMNDLQTEILVLTDGQIWDQQALFDLVQGGCKSGDVRVFSLGIGEEVSHALVEGLARAGNGYAQIVGKNDKLDAKVVRMLKAALTVHVKKYHLHFAGDGMNPSTPTNTGDCSEDFVMLEAEKLTGESNKKEKTVISLFDLSVDPDKKIDSKDRFSHLPPLTVPRILQTPYEIPSLYPFTRTNVYLFLSSESLETPASITLRGTTSSGDELELEIPVINVGEGSTLHQLGARKLVQELEEGNSYLHSGKFGVDPKKNEGTFGDWIEREAVRVGTTFGIPGKWTSFVAVENVDADVEEEEQDLDSSSRYARALRLRNRTVPALGSVGSAMTAGAGSFGFSGSATTGSGIPSAVRVASGAVPVFGSASTRSGGASSAAFGSTMLFTQSLLQSSKMMSVKGGANNASTVALTMLQKRSNEASVVEEQSEEERKTYELLSKQAFDGSFSADAVGENWKTMWEKFREWIEERGEAEEEKAKRQMREMASGARERVWATAGAVCRMQHELHAMHSVWDLVAEKAKTWALSLVTLPTWRLLTQWMTSQLTSTHAPVT